MRFVEQVSRASSVHSSWGSVWHTQGLYHGKAQAASWLHGLCLQKPGSLEGSLTASSNQPPRQTPLSISSHSYPAGRRGKRHDCLELRNGPIKQANESWGSGSKYFWESTGVATKGAALNLNHAHLTPERTTSPSPREIPGRKEVGENWKSDSQWITRGVAFKADCERDRTWSSMYQDTPAEFHALRTVLNFVCRPPFHTFLFFSLKWLIKYVTWWDCVVIALQDFPDEKAHKSEKILSDLVLKFLVHKVSSADLETKIGPASSKIMQWIKFACQAFSLPFSLPMVQPSSHSDPTASSQAHWPGCLRPVSGFPLDVELGGAGWKPRSINRRMFCSVEKVVEEAEGQRGSCHHESSWHAVSIHSTDSREGFENPCWSQTHLKPEPLTRNGRQILCLILEFSVQVIWATFFFQTLSFHLCDAELVTTEGWVKLSADSVVYSSKAVPCDSQDGDLRMPPEPWVSVTPAPGLLLAPPQSKVA